MRKVAEAGTKHAKAYCSKEQLQFINVARASTRLSFSKQQGFYWRSIFDFEFSGDGESSSQGHIILHGLRLMDIDVPAYRIH